jgi:hypothetical protein
MRGGVLADVAGDVSSAGPAGSADIPAPSSRGFLLVVFAFIALAVAEVVLVLTTPGLHYAGPDGKAAQAEILATLEFARPFSITNLNPLQGLGSQMMPMNVWVNPAYWPFAFFDKELASEISGIIAFICYVAACYVMARCVDVPRIPSIIAAQLSIMLFAPAVWPLALMPNFAAIPGQVLVYAPHLVAFGLLTRLSPERPQVWFIAGGLLALLFYSLYCDPLWTAVSGLAWIVPFAVATFSAGRRDIILARCAVLGGCVAVLLLSGALEYMYLLSQYTARVQFPDLLGRPRLPEFTSVVLRSQFGAWFYRCCVPGWVLGIWLLRGRPRILVLACAVSALSLLAYSVAFLYLPGNWWLPIPIYIEHTLLALFWTAAIAGYWGGLEALAARFRRWINAGDGTDLVPVAWRPRMRSLSLAQAGAGTAIVAMMTASVVPIVAIAGVPREVAKLWYEPWPDEPELRNFLASNIGLRAGTRFRGSTFFYTFQHDEFLTMDSLWADAVPTANEYSQLVTPQAIYLIHQLVKRKGLSADLNWFRPWIDTGGVSFPMLFRTLRAFGVRYLGGYQEMPDVPGIEGLRFESFQRRPPNQPPALWVMYEFPDVNVGDYSPTEVIIAEPAADAILALGVASFDFSRQVILSTELRERLVPAHDMALSVIRSGWHLSGRSDGTSLVLLPQQFSHCLRAHDARVRLVRADLILTGVIFSGTVDTDISFDFGIFSPGCRRGDLADVKQLGLRVRRE